MTRLSVNVNKVASLRNARGGNNPNLIQVVKDCESYGAEGITRTKIVALVTCYS